MISHSQKVAFSDKELDLLKQATMLTSKIDDIPYLRCHEVARAIGSILQLSVQDGYFGSVEHSWLWSTSTESKRFPPNVLDVYAIGSLPQVQLISMRYMLPHNENYVWEVYGTFRTDIKQDVVDQLIELCLYHGPK